MNSELLTSRFIKVNDPKTLDFVFKLPGDWWSRHYEYLWASEFVEKEDVCLDAACGVMHPLKFYLLEHCEKTYACDLDDRLFNEADFKHEIIRYFGQKAYDQYQEKYADGIHYSKQNLTSLDYPENFFDKIYCISVVEHMPDEDVKKTLREFARTLKDEGLIVLTLDYPTLNIQNFFKGIEEAGLKFAGEVDLVLGQDALYSPLLGGLNCFRAVLKKS